MKTLTGWHVFGMFVIAFATIIAVNLTLAFNAVNTFPGLEVRNSYVASQGFEAERAAQLALDWDVTAEVRGGELRLRFLHEGAPVAPRIDQAVFGRATSVAADQTPDFRYEDGAFLAPVHAGPGNWNLRIRATAADGTPFQQRIVVEVIE